MPVKTVPLNIQVMENRTPIDFFGTILPRRRPSKFYVYGRQYINKDTAPGTLVLFHYQGKIVAYARLAENWLQDNDDLIERAEAKAVYVFRNIEYCIHPIGIEDLPVQWQASWGNGRFDQNPRTLDDQFEQDFLNRIQRPC